ncbi:MAG: peptidylprolyl isomerase [Bacteroidia bacterium]
MTILAKIRDNISIVVGVIAISLAAFIVSSAFDYTGKTGSGVPDVGFIKGEAIPYKEYKAKLDEVEKNYQTQGQTLNEAMRMNIQDQVWNQLVSEKVYKTEYEALGLGVSGDELVDMFAGKNISQVVKQQFEQFFKEQNKAFNGEDVLAFLQQATKSGNAQQKDAIRNLEKYLAETRLQEKYQTLISGAYLGSKAMAKRKNIEGGRKVTANVFGVNFASIVDSTLKVDDNELRAYISKHAEEYKQEEATVIKYVQFDVRPSGKDSVKAKEKVMKWYEGFATAKDDSVYTAGKSSTPYNKNNYVSLNQIPAEIKDSLKAKPMKSVIGPVLSGGAYKLFKVVDMKMGKEPQNPNMPPMPDSLAGKMVETYLLAEVARTIDVSDETNNGVYSMVNDFAAKAQAKKDIEATAKELNLLSSFKQSAPLEKNTKMLMGMPARQLILWALENKEGAFSEVQSLDGGQGNAYVFAQVFKKKAEGVKDLEDVKDEVTAKVRNEKKSKMILDKLAKITSGDLNKMKEAYGAGAFVSAATDITFDTPAIPGIGNDPVVVGKIVSTAKGTTSKTIVGKNGIYIVQPTAVTEAAAADDKMLADLQKNAQQQAQSSIRSKIEQALVKSADVKDERYKAKF